MTLLGKYYIDHTILEKEMKTIFLKGWICAGHISEFSKTGDFKTINVDKESIIILRDNIGGFRAFFNLCRHRGTRLCTKSKGNLSKSIQCGYHGWTYDMQGNLIGAPNMGAVTDFNKSDYPLNKVALVEWEGFIFINLSDNPVEFKTEFAPIMNRFSEWGIPELKIIESKSYSVNCNWKLIVQNYSECYHCPIIHPELAEITPYTEGRNDLASGPFLGGYMEMKGETISESGQLCGPMLGNLTLKNQKRVYYYALFPNILLSLHPDYVMLHSVWPEGVDKCRVECGWYFSEGVADDKDYSPENAVNFWHKTNRQDWDICEQSYLGIQSRKYQPGPYSGQESLLAAYDEHYLSVLGYS